MATVKGTSFASLLDEPKSPEEIALEYYLDIVGMVGERLDENNMSKKQLAEKMNMRPSQLSRLFSGQTNMTLLTLARFDKALDLGIEFKNAMWRYATPYEASSGAQSRWNDAIARTSDCSITSGGEAA